MKYFHSLFALLFFGCLFNQNLQAQRTIINDSVDIGKRGETALHDVWYSMQEGEILRRDASDWDLAFQIEAREAGIRINSVKGVKLWLFSEKIEDWMNTDTVGKLTVEKQLYNSDTSWNYGAFNVVRNWSDPFDYGWGKYDRARQVVVGNKVYIIQLANKQYYKIRITILGSDASEFSVEYMGLDNSNPVSFSVDRKPFADRNFAYYSFSSNIVFNREPIRRIWDLLFCRYHTTIQGKRTVVEGVLHNHTRTFFTSVGTSSAKIKPFDINNFGDGNVRYKSEINTIGADWKTWNEVNSQYGIEDSLGYLVEGYDNNKFFALVFTGFNSVGIERLMFKFYTSVFRVVGRSEMLKSNFRLYPNPAGQFLNFDLPQELSSVHYSIINMNGQTVLTGASEGQINIRNLPTGVYNLHLELDGKREIIRWIKD